MYEYDVTISIRNKDTGQSIFSQEVSKLISDNKELSNEINLLAEDIRKKVQCIHALIMKYEKDL